MYKNEIETSYRTWNSKVTFCLSHSACFPPPQIDEFRVIVSLALAEFCSKEICDKTECSGPLRVYDSSQLCTPIYVNSNDRCVQATTAITWTIYHAINVSRTTTNTALVRCWDPRTLILDAGCKCGKSFKCICAARRNRRILREELWQSQ